MSKDRKETNQNARSKAKLIAGSGALFFWESFYLTCSNNSCLKQGNGEELMMALVIALGSSVIGMGFGFMISNYIDSLINQRIGDEKANQHDEESGNVSLTM